MAIKVFAEEVNPNNVLTDSEFENSEERKTGFIPGTSASSQLVNTSLLEATKVCYGICKSLNIDTELGPNSTMLEFYNKISSALIAHEKANLQFDVTAEEDPYGFDGTYINFDVNDIHKQINIYQVELANEVYVPDNTYKNKILAVDSSDKSDWKKLHLGTEQINYVEAKPYIEAYTESILDYSTSPYITLISEHNFDFEHGMRTVYLAQFDYTDGDYPVTGSLLLFPVDEGIDVDTEWYWIKFKHVGAIDVSQLQNGYHIDVILYDLMPSNVTKNVSNGTYTLSDD